MAPDDTYSIATYIRDRVVSTAWRRCSAPEAYDSWYQETIVWEWDGEKRERGAMLDCRQGGLSHHLDLVRRIAEGRPLEDADGDDS